jgi:hypothetical protein
MTRNEADSCGPGWLAGIFKKITDSCGWRSLLVGLTSAWGGATERKQVQITPILIKNLHLGGNLWLASEIGERSTQSQNSQKQECLGGCLAWGWQACGGVTGSRFTLPVYSRSMLCVGRESSGDRSMPCLPVPSCRMMSLLILWLVRKLALVFIDKMLVLGCNVY